MGKKKHKKIRNTFKDWDNVTPEDQMKNADEFFNINKETVKDLGDLGLSDKVFVDKETGLEPEIVSDIINSFGPTSSEFYEEYTDGEEVLFDDKEEAVPESVKRVLDSLNDNITEPHVIEEDDSNEDDDTIVEDIKEEAADEEYSDEDKEDTDSDLKNCFDDVPEDDIPSEDEDKEEAPEEDEDKYIDIRRFGCTVRSGLGIVKFDDGIAPFSLNEHVAMLETDIDPSIINGDIIELFKKALIINRYPAAIYTKEEFIASNILNKGRFVQGDVENAVFVDVLNKYIAVYFVKNLALDRFNDSITNIIDLPTDEFGDPRANVWSYLGMILDTDRFSFANDDDFVEMFYESDYNEKGLVAEYLNEKYIDHSFDEDTEIDIIGRDSVENKFNYVIDMIISDEDDDDEEEEDEVEEPKKEEPVTDVEPLTDGQEALVEALRKKADAVYTSDEKKDDSMVIPVHHKGEKK